MQALQQVVGDSILGRQLQQEIAKQGFAVRQLDASFDRQGVFSSGSGAFSVEIAEVQVLLFIAFHLANASLHTFMVYGSYSA